MNVHDESVMEATEAVTRARIMFDTGLHYLSPSELRLIGELSFRRCQVERAKFWIEQAIDASTVDKSKYQALRCAEDALNILDKNPLVSADLSGVGLLAGAIETDAEVM